MARRFYYTFAHPKKRAFLVATREGASVRKAAEAAKISRNEVYYWQEHDADFSVALGLARQDALESLEDEARRRAVEGVRKEKPIYHNDKLLGYVIETEYSDVLLMFLLKKLDPSYRDKADVYVSPGVSGAHDIPAWLAAGIAGLLESNTGGDPSGVP